ncbi:hypothetical protein [Anabaena sp. PCC 7108]|uniref:hypothetical protein n=1 Tax=Anabaena sp. PCC 7108 TaxID=163908 RepID=UPI00130EA805|nr:hypothetical protein [Anabaena sp. PCC 7108]
MPYQSAIHAIGILSKSSTRPCVRANDKYSIGHNISPRVPASAHLYEPLGKKV